MIRKTLATLTITAALVGIAGPASASTNWQSVPVAPETGAAVVLPEAALVHGQAALRNPKVVVFGAPVVIGEPADGEFTTTGSAWK